MEDFENLEDPQSQSYEKPSLGVSSLHSRLMFQWTLLQIIIQSRCRGVGQIEDIWWAYIGRKT